MQKDDNYVDPFTSEASAGERIKEEENSNVCVSCEG